MNRWQKFAYCYTVGMTLIIFMLFLHSYLPHIIMNNDWERAQQTMITSDFMKQELQSHTSFKAFIERYPNATLEFTRGNSGSTYQIAIGNFTSNTSLLLDLNYSGHNGKIKISVSCDKFDKSMKGDRLYGVLVTQYIKENTCMEKGVTGPLLEKGKIIFNDTIEIMPPMLVD